MEGVFTCDDAQEILSNMFHSKINYHKLKNWSSNERFGTDDEIALHRIPLLKLELQKLQAILSEAKSSNKKLIVSSEISITVAEE